MPRFNFSSYISKNSLTQLNTIDPQADWEHRHSSGRPGMKPKRSHSATSSEIDRQLVSEINNLTGGNYTLEDLGLPQEKSPFSDTESQVSSETKQKKAGFQKMENLHIEGAETGTFKKEDSEVNQSSNQGTENPNTPMSPRNAGTNASRSTTPGARPNSIDSPRDAVTKAPQPTPAAMTPGLSPREFRQTSSRPGTPGVPQQHRSPQPPSTPVIREHSSASPPSPKSPGAKSNISTQVSTTPKRTPGSPNQASPRQAEIYSQQRSPKGSNQPTSLLYVDNENFLHPVVNIEDVGNLVQVSNQDAPLPPMPIDIKDALVRLEHMPMDQVTHFAHLGDYVRHLQANERICDVTIHIGTERYMAHRICLACYSDYFADIFYSRNDKQRVPLTVRLKGIKPVAFEILLKFIYTGVLDVYSEVVGDLMTMAESLRIPMVKTRVIDFLECLPLAKALSILMKEKIFGPMYDRAMIAVCEQFNTFRQEEVFLEIEVEPLVMLLSRDNLNIQTEMDVFKGIVRWVSNDTDDRKQHLVTLMQCVRFPYMTLQELSQCNEITDLVKESREVAQMLLEANWVCVGKMLCKEDRFNLHIPKPRTCISSSPAPSSTTPANWSPRDESAFAPDHDVAYTSPQAHDLPLHSPQAPNNNSLMRSNVETTRHRSFQKNANILVIGGFNPPSSRAAISAKALESYTVATNEWKHFGDLPEPRLHYAACILDDKIFITGGVDPRFKVKNPVPTADVFTFDVKRNSWIKVMKLNTPRMYHSMCSVLGMVYVIGGQDGDNNVLNSVECYNPMNDSWFYVKSMSEPRLGAAASLCSGKLFIAGGYGDIISKTAGSHVLDTVECFDPRSNSWVKKNNLRFPRCHGNLVCCNGRMYLCGGATRSYNNKDSVITSTGGIDVYNSRDDVWEHCTDMVVPRHDAAAAVVGELIYILGGCSTETNRILRSVECYDTATDSWISGIHDLPYPSKWIKSVTITK